MKPKSTHLIIASLILFNVVISAVNNVSADNLFLTADELLADNELDQYDNRYFESFSAQYVDAKQHFEEGKQQSWSRHAYIADIAKMYEATLDPKYFGAFREFVKLIYDMRSDKLEPPMGDQVRGTVNDPKIVKAWVAHEKSYGSNESVWGATEGVAAFGNQLYIVQNKRLHKVNPGNGHWVVLPDQGRYTAQIHEAGMYCELILWYSRIVMEDPTLHLHYESKAVEFAHGAIEAIHEFNADLDNDYYIIPEELAPWVPIEAGMPQPYNITHLMLRALIDLTRVIHSDYFQASSYSSVLDDVDYKELAPKIIAEHQAYFKDDWRYLTEESINYLVWPRYPDNWYYHPIKYVTDDFSHASVSIKYILKLYENQGFLNKLLAKSDDNIFIEVTLEDIKRIANTFLFKIDRRIDNNHIDDIEDIFFNAQMDGSRPYESNGDHLVT